MLLEKILKFMAKLGIDTKSHIRQLRLNGQQLTVGNDRQQHTFDLSSGITPEVAAALADVKFSAGDLKNLMNAAETVRHAKSSAETKIAFSTSQTALIGSGPSENPLSEVARIAGLDPDKVNELLHSGKSETRRWLTFNTNGETQTFDTTSGISDALTEQLAAQVGLSSEQFKQIISLLPGQTAGTPSSHPPTLPASGPRQQVICPKCGHSVALAERCLYCGKKLNEPPAMLNPDQKVE